MATSTRRSPWARSAPSISRSPERSIPAHGNRRQHGDGGGGASRPRPDEQLGDDERRRRGRSRRLGRQDRSGPATPGDDLTYVLTVANAGPSDGSDVALSDALPSGTTFVSVAQTSGPAAAIVAPAVGAGGVVTASWASFASGGTATFDVVVNINVSIVAGDTITNTATVTEGGSQAVGFFGLAGGFRPLVDPNPANDASTVVTEIVAGPVVPTTTDPPGPTTTTEAPVSTTQPPTSTTLASAAGELPRTGSDTGTIGRVAALVVMAGAAAVVLGTYRRREV